MITHLPLNKLAAHYLKSFIQRFSGKQRSANLIAVLQVNRSSSSTGRGRNPAIDLDKRRHKRF